MIPRNSATAAETTGTTTAVVDATITTITTTTILVEYHVFENWRNRTHSSHLYETKNHKDLKDLAVRCFGQKLPIDNNGYCHATKKCVQHTAGATLSGKRKGR